MLEMLSQTGVTLMAANLLPHVQRQGVYATIHLPDEADKPTLARLAEK
jgi:hypothetical protein